MKAEGKEIINELLNYTGVKAPTFASYIGVKYERILCLQNGRTKKITLDLADKICEAYPEINKAYLLKGEGSLLNSAGSNINVSHSPHAIAGNDINISQRVTDSVEADNTITKRDLFEVVRHLQHLNDQHLKKNEALMIANDKLKQVLNDVIAVMIEELPPHKLKAIYAKINSELQNLQR